MVSGNGSHTIGFDNAGVTVGGQKRPRVTSSDVDEYDAAEGDGGEDVRYAIGDLLLCPVKQEGLDKVEGQVVAVGTDSSSSGDYYIHFVGRDRRLDRWVKREEITPKDRRQDRTREVHGPRGDAASVGSKFRDDARPEVEVEAKFTRSRRRLIEQLNPVSEKEQGSEYVAKMERAREEKTKIKNFSRVTLAPYIITVWYYAPFPVPSSEDIYICPACLKYTTNPNSYNHHLSTCNWATPPGSRIYTDMARGITVYEVDGLVNAPYCQRLCLLAKLFLDHKTLYFDVAPFLFYVVTTSNDLSSVGSAGGLGKEDLSGFFSKEKDLVNSEHNLACILTLPPHQRKGLGRFMIAFSYELTRRESKTAGPERPLSDLGQVSYRSFWNHAIVKFMRRRRGALNVAVSEVAKETGIRSADVISTLKLLNMMNIWKGEMYVSSSTKVVDEAAKRVSEPRLPLIKSLLKWEDPNKAQRNREMLDTLDNQTGKRRTSTSRNPATSPKKRARRNAKSGLIMGAFSEEEVAKMKEFVKRYGAERVLAPLNSKDGIPSTLVHDLAKSMEMSMERCRKKLKRISSQAIEAGLDLYPSDNRLGPAESSPQSPQDMRDSNIALSPESPAHREENGFTREDDVEDFVMEDGFDRGKVPNGGVNMDLSEADKDSAE